MPLILAVFLLVFAEIAVLVAVGGAIGVLPTLGIVLGTGVLGAVVLRSTGTRALERAAAAAEGPEGPLAAAGDGVLRAMAGVLLILPGFLGDLAGLVLLIPPVREALLRRFARQIGTRASGFTVRVVRPVGGARREDPYGPIGGNLSGIEEGEIIEGEVLDPPPRRPQDPR